MLAAGEMMFAVGRRGFVVSEVTNQSTGYCPEPSSFEAVRRALLAAGVEAPEGFSTSFVFRRCPGCSQINLVKDDEYACASCGSELPRVRNF